MSPPAKCSHRRPVTLVVVVVVAIGAASTITAAVIGIIPDLLPDDQTRQPAHNSACVVVMLDEHDLEMPS